ncbi:ABC transporter permease [Alphaproteobacteria bacterium]|nr:ABC transporter permease [Alphaproteobacteria bacterium]
MFFIKQVSGNRRLPEKKSSAFEEFFLSLIAWDIWFYLGLNDITKKFRRTTLGHGWVLLGNAIGLTAISVLWSFIFNLGIGYIAYVVFGFLVWGLVSTLVTKSCDIFHGEFVGIILNSPLPIVVHCLRFCFQHFLNFVMFAPYMILVMFVSGQYPTVLTGLVFCLSLIVVLITGLAVSIVFGTIGARYRDFSPLVNALMMPMMLVTPVMWKKDLAPEAFWLFNPFTHYVDILREPLLGNYPSVVSIMVCLIMTGVLVFISYFCYVKYRFKIVGWL